MPQPTRRPTVPLLCSFTVTDVGEKRALCRRHRRTTLHTPSRADSEKHGGHAVTDDLDAQHFFLSCASFTVADAMRGGAPSRNRRDARLFHLLRELHHSSSHVSLSLSLLTCLSPPLSLSSHVSLSLSSPSLLSLSLSLSPLPSLSSLLSLSFHLNDNDNVSLVQSALSERTAHTCPEHQVCMGLGPFAAGREARAIHLSRITCEEHVPRENKVGLYLRWRWRGVYLSKSVAGALFAMLW